MSKGIGRRPGILAGARTTEFFYSTGLRALFAFALAAAIIGTASTADAAVPKRAKIAKKDKETRKAAAPVPKGPLHIIVSIGKQRVALYANGAHVATSPISTGTRTHPTPTGVFSIIQKNRHHRSNIYSGAPMPYMQRITWSGVALHQGVLPGYPASHGCIRLPTDFASYLWTATKMNARVIVTHGDVAPVDVAHSRLFVFKKPVEQPVAAPVAPEKSSEAPRSDVRTAEAADPRKASDAPKPSDAVMLAAGGAPKPVAAKAVETPKARVVSAEHPERNKTRDSSKLVDNGAVDTNNTITNAVKEGSKVTPIATGAIAPPAPVARTAAASAPAAPVPSIVMELKPTVPATVPLPVAKPPEASPTIQVIVPDKTDEPAKTEEVAKPKPPKPDPISVFISRKTGKLYVRHGWEPLFEVPVTIRNPEAVWGTHVFTALEFKEDQSTLRWVAVTLPPDAPRRVESKRTTKNSTRREVAPPPPAEPRPQLSASQVLDLLDIPQEAIDRISELMKPGSSLIVSDNPMSHETGKGTDFVILTRS